MDYGDGATLGEMRSNPLVDGANWNASHSYTISGTYTVKLKKGIPSCQLCGDIVGMAIIDTLTVDVQ